MTLADMLATLPRSYYDLRTYALVFDAVPNNAMTAIRKARPTARHQVAPIQLTTGQWMLCADILTEISTGKLYGLWFRLLPADLFLQIKVISWSDAFNLLPPPPAEPYP